MKRLHGRMRLLVPRILLKRREGIRGLHGVIRSIENKREQMLKSSAMHSSLLECWDTGSRGFLGVNEEAQLPTDPRKEI